MAEYTIEQYIEVLRKRLALMEDIDEPVYKAASSAHAEMIERIFTRGEASDGTLIGKYDTTKPLYVNPDRVRASFQPKGKTGKTKHEDGTPYKTGYFESYKAFRAKQGASTETVNLNLTNEMARDFSNGLIHEGLGSYVATFKERGNIKKAIGNQYHFRKVIFGATQKERELFTEALQLELNARLSK